MGNPAHMDFRNYLPDGGYLCAGSGDWILQSASGFQFRTCNSKPCTGIWKA